ncbi:MAG: SPASM domain-containing protein [Candidatus Omnitrophota bacterium]
MHNELFKGLDTFMEDDCCSPYIDKNIYVRYVGVGEPLLNPDLIEMIKVSLFNLKVKQLAILSNGACWNRNFIDSFTGIIAMEPHKPIELIFSLDTLNPEVQYAIKKMDNIKTINEQLIYLLEQKARLYLNNLHPILQAIILDENIGEVNEFLDFWINIFKAYGFSWRIVGTPTYPVYFSDTDCFLWLKTKDTDNANQERFAALQQQAFSKLKTGLSSHLSSVIEDGRDRCKGTQVTEQGRFTYVCSMLWYGINMSANGDVSPCCIDVDYCLKLGNIGKQSIVAIYHSDKMKNLRESHIKKRLENYPFCMNCVLSYKGLNVGDEEVLSYLRSIS